MGPAARLVGCPVVTVHAPLTEPDLSLVFPESDGLHPALLLSNGQALVDMGDSDIEVATDELGARYYTLPPGVATLNLVDLGDPPEQVAGPTVAVMRLRARNVTPFYEEATELNTSGSSAGVIFLSNTPVGGAGLDNSRVGTGDATYAAFVPTETPVDAAYQELRLRAESGAPTRWHVFDPSEGDGPAAVEGEDTDSEVLFAPLWVTNINLATYPGYINPERVRLYSLDVWLDPAPGGMWHSRQRQNTAGNAGGLPSRRRQNGGYAGGFPSRRRQTGL